MELDFNRVLVSRQPIYRGNMQVFGYELLFRSTSCADRAAFSDGNSATAEVISNSLIEIGLDEIIGPHRAFINFDRELILSPGYCEAIPKDRVVLEVLETLDLDDEVVQRLKLLAADGYQIALDDFVDFDKFLPLLEIASIVKLDVMAVSQDRVAELVRNLRPFNVKLLAEKVETYKDFEHLRDIGCDYFQGFFFCRPQIVTTGRLPVNRMAILNLIANLNKPDIQMDEIEEALKQDVSMSYKLLRYANSAILSLRHEVYSIRHASMLIGLEKLKVWASLVLFSAIDGKPRDVIVTGLTRARMCERLAQIMKSPGSDLFFLVGLFSVLDAVVDRPLPEIVRSLPLAPDVSDAIVNRAGAAGRVLDCVISFEMREWAKVASLNLEPLAVSSCYQHAVRWTLDALKQLEATQPAVPSK